MEKYSKELKIFIGWSLLFHLSHRDFSTFPGVCWHPLHTCTGLPELPPCSPLHPLILLWPSQAGKQNTNHLHRSLLLCSEDSGETPIQGLTHLSPEKGQGKNCPYSASLQLCKKQAQVRNCPFPYTHTALCAPSEGRQLPLLADGHLPPWAQPQLWCWGSHPQPLSFCWWELIWQAQPDFSAYNPHAADEKQKHIEEGTWRIPFICQRASIL